jgi:peptide/nickel transport system substrate-binding protein
MKKKGIIILLALTMVLSTFLAACAPKDEPVATPDPAPAPAPAEPAAPAEPTKPTSPTGSFTIGNITELSGDWIPWWQNNAADYDIYNMITGYPTVGITFNGEYVIDETVVAKHEVTENEDGSKTHTFTINDGLTYADGTPITAKDYVTSIMLWSSNVVGEMGAQNTYGMYFAGWEEFAKGTAKEFKGVRIIDDMNYSVTIAAENLPFFFELALIKAVPAKLDFWTDETVEIKDDGNGAYFSDNFTKENFEARLNAARREVPRPSSGAYVLESYDEASKTAVVKVNDKYAGNYEGQKPLIETIIYKKVNSETSLDELATGSVDLLSGMASGDEINGGMDLVDKGGFAYSAYPRSGFGRLLFQCDFGPTQFKEVRQAIAHLLDRNDFAKAFTGGYGSVVHGPYGESMWFYQETKAQLNEKLNPYPYSLDEAVKLLEQAGFTLDANGNPYTSGVRYKKMDDGTLMPLIIEWASTEQNVVSELLVVKLQQNPDLAKAGIQLNQTQMTFTELLNWLYRDSTQGDKYGVPTYGMFNLAIGYTPDYDISPYYTTDEDLIAQGYNENYIRDEQLAKLTKEMVLVDSEDKEGFKAKFVETMDRWNELLPDVPLYSNMYHDFYNEKLKDYQANDIIEKVDALIYAWIAE